MKPGFLTAYMLASLVALAGVVGAQSKLELDKAQKLKDWGYSIRPIKGWNSIPADQEDKYCVGRWKPDLSEYVKRGNVEGFQGGQRCELKIIRIPIPVESEVQEPPEAAEAPESGEAGKEPPKEPEKKPSIVIAAEKRANPKSVDDYLEGTYEGASKRWSSQPIKAGKLSGELLEFGSGDESVSIGVFRLPSLEWAVVYSAYEESYRKTWREIYLKSMETFEAFEPSSADVTATARLDIGRLQGEAKRKALRASIAGNPGWYAIETPAYVFLSNSENESFIKTLAKEVQLVRDTVYTKMFPPRNTGESISPVRVLDSELEYYQYGGPGGSAGYFNSDSGELVLYTKGEFDSKAESLANCRSVAYHEAFHQYVHHAIGDVSPHSWFNEGHGDYFAGLVISGSRCRFKPFDWRVDFLKDHLRNDRDLIPLRTLIRLPQNEYYTNGGLKYSEGWALIYFLRNVTKDKDHQQILDKYFTHVVENVEAFHKKKAEDNGDKPQPEKVPGIPIMDLAEFEDQDKVDKILSDAVDVAFEGVDLEELDRQFQAWVKKL